MDRVADKKAQKTRYVDNGWRASDGIHLTAAGGARLAGTEYDMLAGPWSLPR